MLCEPIPKVEMPEIKEYEIHCVNEPLVSLSDSGFKVRPMYYELGYDGAYPDCYARKSVVEKLRQAEKFLPAGYKFLVYDAWRSVTVQQSLWDKEFTRQKQLLPSASLDELERQTCAFVSKPSYDMLNPSVHNTGGAIDLTIIDSNGCELDMGTEFDAFGCECYTAYYENPKLQDSEEIQIRNNRRLLHSVMTKAGFTNLPSEWWHYDYGTKFWAYYKNENSLYAGIRDLPLVIKKS